MKVIVIGLATAALMVGCTQQSCEDKNRDTIRKYERWVQELRAKDALSRSLLEERTDNFDRKVEEMERRSAAREQMIDRLHQDISFETWPLNEEFFKMITAEQLGLTGEESVRDIARAVQAATGADGENALSEQLTIERGQSNIRISYTIEGLSDPRILAKQYVVETTLTPEVGMAVIGYGVRQRCRVDRVTAKWGKEPCA